MTATIPNDFKKLLLRIPKERIKKIWFIGLRQNKKNPDCPKGTLLKGNKAYRISPNNALWRLKWGKNVGVYGLNGGLMFLDVDVEKGKIKASDILLNKIPETLTVRSRNGGLQFYYLNDGVYDNQIFKENGIEIGELRTDWQYVVSAGSFVEPDEHNFNGDGSYRIINDVPIAPFSGLEDYFDKRGIEKPEVKQFTSKPKKDNAINIEVYNKTLASKKKKRRLLTEQEIKALILRYKK